MTIAAVENRNFRLRLHNLINVKYYTHTTILKELRVITKVS